MTIRTLHKSYSPCPTSDGAGVKLRRSLGQSQLRAARSVSDARRVFVRQRRRLHRRLSGASASWLRDGDVHARRPHAARGPPRQRGDLKSGGVQWMTAGRGIIHSEMPQQDAGRMRGFQLWINLPAKEKMKPAGYRDIQPSEIPVVAARRRRVKVIAGKAATRTARNAGPDRRLTTDPLYLDVELPAGATFTQPVTRTTARSLRVRGRVASAIRRGASACNAQRWPAVRRRRDSTAGGCGRCAFLLLAGKPIGEPIVQYGPFVMNTREEIEQAIREYQHGALTG